MTSGTFYYDTSYRVSTVVDGLPGPFYLAIDTADILYVSLGGNGAIMKIDTSGLTTTLPNITPIGLAIDIHNNLFASVSIGGGMLLDKISPAGDTTIIGGITGFALGLAVDTSDNLYFCNVTQNLVERMTPQGVLDTIASGLFSPSGIGVALNGTVYVTIRLWTTTARRASWSTQSMIFMSRLKTRETLRVGSKRSLRPARPSYFPLPTSIFLVE